MEYDGVALGGAARDLAIEKEVKGKLTPTAAAIAAKRSYCTNLLDHGYASDTAKRLVTEFYHVNGGTGDLRFGKV